MRQLRPSRRVFSAAAAALIVMSFTSAAALRAQPKATTNARSDATSLVGAWAGTASVPLGDSTLTVPVMYTFTQAQGNVSGQAVVPGQGMGQISNVVRDGAKVKFRVSVVQNDTTRILEHEGTLANGGALEGIVNYNSMPVAKFRISPKK